MRIRDPMRRSVAMSTATGKDGSQPSLATLVRGLSILEALADAPTPHGLSHATLAHRLGFQRSTLYRYLGCLQERGYVEPTDEGQRYRLGSRVVVLGAVAFGERGFTRSAKRFVDELALATGETAHATLLDDDHVVTVEIADGDGPVGPRISLGSRRPAHQSASGKVFLAFGPERRRAAYLGGRLEAATALTVTDPHELAAILRDVRRQGYATDQGEYVLGISCVAAPVFDFRGEVAGALSVSVAAGRFDTQRLDRLLLPLLRTARALSENLGHAGPRRHAGDSENGQIARLRADG